MIKTIFKILWCLIVITCILLTIYFLATGGLNELGDLAKDNGGFFGGIKQFFINLWEGIKASFVK